MDLEKTNETIEKNEDKIEEITKEMSERNIQNTNKEQEQKNENDCKIEQENKKDEDEKKEIEENSNNNITLVSKDKNISKKRKAKRFLHKIWKEIIEWLQMFAFVLSCFIITFSVFLINAKVPSSSMETTLMTNSRLIANRLAYTFGQELKYEDIVIFPAPDEENKLYIKRVIGLPGDEIEIIKGVTYRNGKKLEEPYVNFQSDSYGPYIVPEGCFFAMGDNRDASWDSRFWTNKYVPIKEIEGKALFTYWPLNEIKILK